MSPSTLKKKQSADITPILNWVLLAGIWGIFFIQLRNEWWINEQYNYGLFIPLIGAYLIHLRWQDRPDPSPLGTRNKTTLSVFILIIGALTLSNIIFWANIDWRKLLWAEGLIITLATLFLLQHWGGRSWLKHFAPAFLIFLFGIPWPHVLETELVQSLMRVIAMMTVEVMNLMGIFAIQQGNAIALTTGTVSVEEACSGVRSFQSTIMAGYFLGELVRFSPLSRTLLITLAAVFSLFYNFCRTLLLTWITSVHGPEMLERWHDPAGYFVFLASFATLAIICYSLKKNALKQRRQQKKKVYSGAPNWIPLKSSYIIIALIVAIEPIAFAWYAIKDESAKKAPDWSIDWVQGAPSVEFKKIPKSIKDILFYSKGVLANWLTPKKEEWLVYFFEWDSAEAAQLSGFHNPELCLPAVGWQIEGEGEDFIWEKENLTLIFNTYSFTAYDYTIYVFNCEWDPAGYPYYQKMGRLQSDRLYDAWIGDRKAGKKTLEVIMTGYQDINEAKKDLLLFLQDTIVITPDT